MDKDIKQSVLVSIVIPFYDELDYLEEAIRSVLEQDLHEFEILAVCNQADYITSIQKERHPFNHPSVRWLSEPRRGSAFARNLGLQHAGGEWVQFLDVDDLLVKGKIEAQLQHKSADVIISPHTYVFLNGRKVSSAWAPADIWSGLLASTLGSTSSMLWKRAALKTLGGWNEDYYSNQEYELLFRVLQAGFVVVPVADNLTIVRERPSGSITKTTRHKPMAGIQLREHIWRYLISKGMDTPERFSAFQKFVFKNLRALYINDPAKAREIHKEYFSGTPFIPEIRGIPFYHTVYKLLGFDLTERLMHIYRYTRDHFFKSLPANG